MVPGVVIEKNVFVGSHVMFDVAVTICEGVMIGPNVSFHTRNHKRNFEKRIFEGLTDVKPIVVGKNSWIGEKCTILNGVKIGEFTTIGAASVVTKDIPDNCMACGVPAVVKKVYEM